MQPPSERAALYRVRAEELRTISSEWSDPETRSMLDRVARDYDRMAASLEKQEPSSASGKDA